MLLATQKNGSKSHEGNPGHTNIGSARDVQRGKQVSRISLCQQVRFEATHTGPLKAYNFCGERWEDNVLLFSAQCSVL